MGRWRADERDSGCRGNKRGICRCGINRHRAIEGPRGRRIANVPHHVAGILATHQSGGPAYAPLLILQARPRSNPPRKPRLAHGSRRLNRISQAVPTALRRVGLPHCRADIRPSSIWGGQTKGRWRKTMTELRYLAPSTLDEAIGAFAAAGSAARILAGGTDLLVQMRSGVLKPGVIVDIKKIAEMTDDRADRRRRLSHRRGRLRHGAPRPREFRQGLARRAGGGQPDRLQTGAGPGVRGRQSLQRLARRRQRARDGRGRRHRHRAGPERPPRNAGGRRAGRSRPHQSEARRNPGQLYAAAAPARFERCLSAHDPAHRNGHRRGRRRRQPDDEGRRLSPPPASASARSRRPCCWSRTPPRR